MKREDQDNVMWNRARICRTHCDVQDFESAESMLQKVLADPNCVDNLKEMGRLALKLELAYILERLGKDDEAFKLRGELAKQLAESNAGGEFIVYEHFDRMVQLESELRSSKEVDLGEFIRRLGEVYRLADNDSDRSHTARVYGVAYERAGQFDEAIKWYEAAATKRVFYNEMFHLDDVESALLGIYTRTKQLPRGELFFEYLLDARQNQLDPRHPTLAFTRVLLAQTLILQGIKLENAKMLLDDARQLLEANELTPDSVLQDIDDLQSQVQEKMDAQEGVRR